MGTAMLLQSVQHLRKVPVMRWMGVGDIRFAYYSWYKSSLP